MRRWWVGPVAGRDSAWPAGGALAGRAGRLGRTRHAVPGTPWQVGPVALAGRGAPVGRVPDLRCAVGGSGQSLGGTRLGLPEVRWRVERVALAGPGMPCQGHLGRWGRLRWWVGAPEREGA